MGGSTSYLRRCRTVTKAHLELYGRWEFHDASKYTAQREEESKIRAQDIYVPITLNGSPISWTTKPFKETAQRKDGTFHIPKDCKPDRDIREAWWWIRVRLIGMDLLPQKFPVEWTVCLKYESVIQSELDAGQRCICAQDSSRASGSFRKPFEAASPCSGDTPITMLKFKYGCDTRENA
jgi:hypothetical protein